MYRTADPKPQFKRLVGALGVHPDALRGWIRQADDVAAAPSSAPVAPPSADSSSDSVRNWSRIALRVAPSERRRPISWGRSRTEMTMVLATPTPPTRRATAPRPSIRVVSPSSVAALAGSASEGRETLTLPSLPGLMVRARMARTSSTEASVVFDRFYKADAARTRGAADDSGQGSGLGTAIALENARLHGGTIDVADGADGPQRGVVFTLRLPLRRTGEGTE